ncbi:hypothetical protein C7M51_00299 [Mixta intestinalis]|uniref:Uncharacterized protein n=1 Tax=Mixta intestinalis TaxID=1615494 RepID=A0A6P1PVW9_9GAMM|nr:hypothetical protein C7M51_00299 [Mixta intestinalis]
MSSDSKMEKKSNFPIFVWLSLSNSVFSSNKNFNSSKEVSVYENFISSQLYKFIKLPRILIYR